MKVSACKILSEWIARAVTRMDKLVLLIARSDMTHYELHEKSPMKDRMAIACI
jgi:AmmeMemoRadiSam system protein B